MAAGGTGTGLGSRFGRLFAGRHFGKHKLAPRISPNKTWEGLFGGLLAGVAVALSCAELSVVTPAQAVAHPKWSMGPKISVDSATLMNKGLEVIEAHHLFSVPGERIEVLVHPQSLVHSLVEFVDGSTLAQMGLPDMRTTLAVGLGWPQRIESGVAGLDLLAQGRLDSRRLTPTPSPAWRWPGRPCRPAVLPRRC